MKPGNVLHLTYSGFDEMTYHMSNGVQDDNKVTANTLSKLGMQEVKAALRTRRLRWFGQNSIKSMTIPRMKII